MKKKTALMLALILIMQIVLPLLTVITNNSFTVSSNAFEETTVDGISWAYEVDENNNATIVVRKYSLDTDITTYNYYSLSGDIVIPGELDGHTVTGIGQSAFAWCTNLTSITIPTTVTSIGKSAFYQCSSLTSVNIPEGVTSIENGTFNRCNSLLNINIPDGVTSIGEDTFYQCNNLTNIEIPTGVTNIGNGAFCECSSLTSINIPDGVTSIGRSTFRGCTNLTNVTIPSSVKRIEHEAFRDCSSLTNINIPYGVTYIGDGAFAFCSSLVNIELPEGLNEIDYQAFILCTSLTSISIPEGVTYIGSNEFAGCISLVNIDLPEGIEVISYNAFYSCTSLTSINIPESVIDIQEHAFYNCSNLKNVKIPKNIENVRENAFEGLLGPVFYASNCGVMLDYVSDNPNETEYVCCTGPQISGVENTTYYETVTPVITENITSSKGNEFDCIKSVTLQKDDGEIEEYTIGTPITEVGSYRLAATDYVGNTNEVEFIISNVELESLEITTPPQKVEYIEGESFNPEGIEITAVYNNGDRRIVTDECSIEEVTSLELGKESIEVSYTEGEITKKAYQPITVAAKELIGIEIKEEPEKKDYYVGDELDTTGLILTLKYNNGSSEDIEEGYICTPTTLNEEGEKEIEVTYGGFTDTFNVNVERIELIGIEITSPPNKIEYIEGETFNPEGMVVVAHYNDSRKDKEITEYTIDKTEGLTLEDNEIVVSYEGKMVAQPITVAQKELVRIEIIKEPDKVEYVEKTNFVRDGMIVKAYYNNNTEEEIEDYEIVNGENMQYLQELVTVSYTKNNVTREATQQIAVVKRGDANRDGNVDIRDIFRINKHRLGKLPLTGVLLEASDVTGDGIADFDDILVINKYRLGKIDEV